MRILIVDDHEETRQGVRLLLSERPGWVVCGEAVDGLDAIEKAETLRPDIVLMDVSMPRMNGVNATKAIRQIVPQTKVILVSQNDPAVVSRQASEANAHDHVVKADLSEKLLGTIDAVAGGENGGGLRREVEERFGVMPNFFRLSPETPEITANLWGFAKAAYLDNPLPSLFKERLFVYLSRFCRVRYCIARHAGFLAGLGRPSGDANERIQSAEEIVRLLRLPFLRGEEFAAHLAKQAEQREPLGEIPEVESETEYTILMFAGHVFLQTVEAESSLEALRSMLGEPRLHYVLEFLAFIRTAHYWTKIHPELELEDDVRQLLATHETLAACIYNDPEAGADEVSQRLLDELPLLRLEADKTAGLLAAIVDSSDDAIISKTLDGVITSWNKSAERLFGYSADEAIGRSITLIIPEKRLAEETEILNRIRRGERVEHFETVRLRKNGTPIDIALTVSPVRDSSGRIIGASKVARDITERKSTEAERLKFVALADRCTEFIGMCDLDLRPFYVNSAGMRLVGVEPDNDLSSARFPDFFFPEDRPFIVDEFLPRVLREGAAEVEIRFRHLKTGAPIWIIYNAFAIKDGDGIPIALATFSQNITQRVETERSLAEQARLLDLSSDAILVRDAEDRITYWNKGASELYGFTHEEAVGKVSHELLQTEFPAPPETIAIQVRRDGRWNGELVHTCKNGTRIVSTSRWVVDLDANGALRAVLETNNDVTQEKETEKALRESEERFRSLADNLETKVHVRTQELEERNAEVFRQSVQLRELSRRLLQSQDDERRRIARELHDSAGQTLTILGINLARLAIDAKRNAPQFSKLASESQVLAQQLNQEIRTTSYLLHPPLLDEEGLDPALDWYLRGLKERSGLDIRLKIPQDFGRLPRDLELVVFRLVQECITNVHRHSGSKSAVVHLSRAKDKVTVEVQDRGRGISAERLAEIQSRNAGVGIRGMRERVRQFDGEMNIETSESGTRVTVKLPAPACAAATSGNGVEKARAAG
jgi:PAS domain S-box-containing protein